MVPVLDGAIRFNEWRTILLKMLRVGCVEMQTDILVIGSGLAGLWSSICLADKDQDVVLISKSLLGAGSNTCLSGAAFTASGPGFDHSDHEWLFFSSGQGLLDKHSKLVEQVVQNGEREINELSLKTKLKIKYIKRGRYELETEPNVTIPGGELVFSLANIVRTSRIKIMENATVFSLLKEDGKIWGATGCLSQGEPFKVIAKATILATGGYASCLTRNDNSKRISGDGHLLALNSGGFLRDLEFIQFYPLGMDEIFLPSYLVDYPFPKGTRLESGDEKDIISTHFGPGVSFEQACSAFRDQLSILLEKEILRGKKPTVVFQYLDETIPFCRLLASYGMSSPPIKIKVAPCAHFTMGGVDVDSNLSILPGLFGAGEIVGGLHGANRFSGNALTACLVQGRIASLGALRMSRQNKSIPKMGGKILPFRQKLMKKGKVDDLKKEIAVISILAAKTGMQCIGPVRNFADLFFGLTKIRELKSYLETFTLPDNPPLMIRYYETWNKISLIELSIKSSLARTESRGSHYREDYPNSDNNQKGSYLLQKGEDGSSNIFFRFSN